MVIGKLSGLSHSGGRCQKWWRNNVNGKGHSSTIGQAVTRKFRYIIYLWNLTEIARIMIINMSKIALGRQLAFVWPWKKKSDIFRLISKKESDIMPKSWGYIYWVLIVDSYHWIPILDLHYPGPNSDKAEQKWFFYARVPGSWISDNWPHQFIVKKIITKFTIDQIHAIFSGSYIKSCQTLPNNMSH